MNYGTKGLFNQFKPSVLILAISAGCVIGILTIIVEMSFAAMIFNGPLASFVPKGIGYLLFGSMVITAVVAITSSYPGTIARPHEIPAAVLALVTTSITSSAILMANPQRAFSTVIAIIIVSSLITGAFFFLLGVFKLGRFVRFIPYPVVGGFLAGTGYLLCKGGLNVMTGKSLTLDTIPLFFSKAVLIQWTPGLLFSLLLIIILKKFHNVILMPIILVAGAALFYAVLFATGTSLDNARSFGFMLASFGSGNLWSIPDFSQIVQCDWGILWSQIGKIGSICALAAMALLLNASGLELAVRKDVDFNRELRSAGLANLLAGIGGGPVGIHSLSLSALGFSMGVNTRIIGITASVVIGVTLFFGSSLLAYLPRPILGGLLLYLGFGFLIEWVIDARKKLPGADYVLVLVILVIIAALGFIQGVVAGTIVAVVVFVVNYSRVNVVKYALTGAHYHSNVDRGRESRKVLSEKGDQLYIVKLQGYIFFGTANTLLDHVRQRIDKKTTLLHYLVLDFKIVSGFDSSAVRSFTKMIQIAQEHSFIIVLTHLNPQVRKWFERSSGIDSSQSYVKIFSDLDHGVEWCEEQILAGEGMTPHEEGLTIKEHLSRCFTSMVHVDRFMRILERQDIDTGHYLIRQDERSHHLYFIESGRVTVLLEDDSAEPVRLRTMGAGTIVGELGLYMNMPASASVRAESKAIVYKLTKESLDRIEQTDAELASAFHVYIVRLLGERLTKSNRSLKALQEQ